MSPLLWVVIGLAVTFAVTRPIPPDRVPAAVPVTPTPRGGEPRDAGTATPLRHDVPTARVHRHDVGGCVWHVAVCPCGWASREYADPSDAEFAKALHDMAHVDELQAAS